MGEQGQKSHEDEVARCRQLGADDYVTKPVAFDEFSSAVLGIVARAKVATA